MPEEQRGEGPEDKDTIGIYVGQRNAAGDRHGEGWAVLPNGDYYNGCYCRGLRNAKGLYVFMKNGARYEGEWRKSMKYGLGTMWYPDGSRYEGDWRRDMRQGFGAYYYVNGDIYEGAWFKNKRHGLGTYFFSEVQVKFMGTWIEGVMENSGQIIFPRYRYHGSWEKGHALGPGCFVFDTNCMQHGFHMLLNEVEEELGEEEEKMEPLRTEGEEMPIDEFAGKKSTWRARNVTAYMAELLPPAPLPLPACDSQPSMTPCPSDGTDMMFEAPTVSGEEEGDHDDDSWLQHRQQFLEGSEIAAPP